MESVIVDMHGRRVNHKPGGDSIKFYVYACVISSVSIISGFIWDYAWHSSVGRDRFFTPPHCLIYFGAVVTGCFSGYNVLKTSFWGTAEEKAASVKFWGIFYSSLGGLFCIWGALAMLTSAPFDNWWHNTYGLDTKIFSPPHALLLTGMITIQFGAYMAVVAAGANKQFDKKTANKHNWIFAIAAGSVLATLYTLFSDFLSYGAMHSARFYCASSILFPLFLFAVSRASKTKWGATAATGVYMAELAILLWILPLFPATPMLGPVFNHITHLQPFHFPLLLIFPAIATDLILNHFKNKSIWLVVPLASFVFLLIMVPIQWYFGTFYHTSELAKGWLFASYSLNYATNPATTYRYKFDPALVDHGAKLIKGLVIAYLFALASGFLGYLWGGWIRKVQR